MTDLEATAELYRAAAKERDEIKKHLARVLHLYDGAWHENSILMQEYGHEIEDARKAALRSNPPRVNLSRAASPGPLTGELK